MKPKAIALLLLLTIAGLLVTTAAHSYTGPRFGPWVYFAPYYFPPNGCCKGYCFSPHEWAPRYEDPPPIAPGPFVPGGPPPLPRRSSPAHFGPPL